MNGWIGHYVYVSLRTHFREGSKFTPKLRCIFKKRQTLRKFHSKSIPCAKARLYNTMHNIHYVLIIKL